MSPRFSTHTHTYNCNEKKFRYENMLNFMNYEPEDIRLYLYSEFLIYIYYKMKYLASFKYKTYKIDRLLKKYIKCIKIYKLEMYSIRNFRN